MKSSELKLLVVCMVVGVVFSGPRARAFIYFEFESGDTSAKTVPACFFTVDDTNVPQ